MVDRKLPVISEAVVRRKSDRQSFERGENYFMAGRVFEPVLLGAELRARCQGSESAPYQVSVTLGKGGVAGAKCSCPRGGFCKHIIAVLLSYIRKPRAIRVLPKLEALIESLDRKEVDSLVGEMVKQEPDLIHLIEIFAARRRGEVDVGAYRNLALNALQQDTGRAVEEELGKLSDSAGSLAESDNWLAAGIAYRTVLSEAVSNYGSRLVEIDEEGEIACVVDELAEGLGKSLAKGAPDDKTRREWLDTLLDAVLTDVKLGGMDLAPSAEEVLLKRTTAQEWEWIGKRVRSEMEKYDGYGREALIEFLAGRRESKEKTVASPAKNAALKRG